MSRSLLSSLGAQLPVTAGTPVMSALPAAAFIMSNTVMGRSALASRRTIVFAAKQTTVFLALVISPSRVLAITS
jgi:hypothetical protein